MFFSTLRVSRFRATLIRMINIQNSHLQFAIQAVQAASQLVADIQREMVTAALTKEDRSPVTVADFAAQAVVGHSLHEWDPRVPLVAEEDADVLRGQADPKTVTTVTGYVSRVIPDSSPEDVLGAIDRGQGEVGPRYWTLDPIDGTKGFLRGDQYAICLAYIEEGQVQVGVIGCPNLSTDFEEGQEGPGSLFAAVRGQGSWVTELEGAALTARYQPLHVSREKDSRRARLLRSFESGHTNVGQIVDFTEALNVEVGPVRLDSQAKYALLAGGEAEIYLRLLDGNRKGYREKIWDQASGALLIEEAGGKVTDLDGQPLDFNQGRRLTANRGICATNGILHGETLEALRKIGA